MALGAILAVSDEARRDRGAQEKGKANRDIKPSLPGQYFTVQP
jgi:hypothetical protein